MYLSTSNDFYITKISSINISDLELLNNYADDSLKVYLGQEKSATTIDIPAYFYILYDEKYKIYYELNLLGNQEVFNNDTILTLKDKYTLQESLNGWFKKDSNGFFRSIENDELLSYEDGLLWIKKSATSYSVVKSIKNLDNAKVNLQHLDYKFLYKFEKDSIINLVSNKNIDLLNAKAGLYYAPYPGIGIKNITSFKEIIQKIRSSKKSQMYF